MPMAGKHGAHFHPKWSAPAPRKTHHFEKGKPTIVTTEPEDPNAPKTATEAAAAFEGGADGAIILKEVEGGEYLTAVALPVALSAGNAMRAFPVRLSCVRRRVAEGEWKLELSVVWDPLSKVAIATHLQSDPEVKKANRKMAASGIHQRFTILLRATHPDATFELGGGAAASASGSRERQLVWLCDATPLMTEQPSLSATLRSKDAALEVYWGGDVRLPTASSLMVRSCVVHVPKEERTRTEKLTRLAPSCLAAYVTLPHPPTDDDTQEIGGYVRFLDKDGAEQRVYLTGGKR
jgi:hypothetical protein